MDRLEKFVQKNSDAFDDQTPSSSSWDIISAEIHEKRPSHFIKMAWKIAAAFIIAIGVGIAIKTINHPTIAINNEQPFATEVYEAAVYYEAQINEKQKHLFQLTSNQPELQTGITEDMALLDSAMIDIKKDLIENIANQEVIEAMIQNYRMRLQILEDILRYVDEKQTQSKTNEAHEI